MNRYARPLMMIAAVLLAAFIIKSFFKMPALPFGNSTKDLSLSQFKDEVKNGNVAKGIFKKDTFEGDFIANPPGQVDKKVSFVVIVPAESSVARSGLYQLLDEKNVNYSDRKSVV